MAVSQCILKYDDDYSRSDFTNALNVSLHFLFFYKVVIFNYSKTLKVYNSMIKGSNDLIMIQLRLNMTKTKKCDFVCSNSTPEEMGLK